MPELILKLRDRELKRIAINKSEFTIGRDPDNDLFIDNIGVSRCHTKVLFRNDHFYAVDNGSSNGTFVNGDQVEERLLKDGDEIQLGKYKITFTSAGEIPAFMPTLDTAPQQPQGQKKVRNVFGTLQFSSDEIQNLIKSQDGPGAENAKSQMNIHSADPDPGLTPTSEGDDSKNRLIFGLVSVMVILVLLLVFIILRR